MLFLLGAGYLDEDCFSIVNIGNKGEAGSKGGSSLYSNVQDENMNMSRGDPVQLGPS